MFEYTQPINNSDDTKNLFNGRFGAGLDIPVYQNLSLNGDLGIYTDGLSYVGWGSNIGLRIGI